MTEKKNRKETSPRLPPISGNSLSDLEDLFAQTRPPLASSLTSSRQSDCPGDESVERFFSRSMKKKERLLLEEHLSRCAACRAVFAEIVRENAALTQETEHRLLTQPPSIDLLAPGKTKIAPVKIPKLRPRRQRWVWGFAVATPAAAAASIFIMLSLARPDVNMLVHLNRGHNVRSVDQASLKDGDVLRRGDRFRAEIAARKDGFIYLYLSAGPLDSEFLFPSSSVPQENSVRQGDHLLIPAQGSWVIDDRTGRLETLYLLFSERPISSEEMTTISGELEKQGKAPSQIKEVLSRQFSIEQEISFQHE